MILFFTLFVLSRAKLAPMDPNIRINLKNLE